MREIEKIWAEYHQRLSAFVRNRVPPDDADDLLQDIFLKIYTKLDTLDDSAVMRYWLIQVARNTVTDYYRRRRPTEALPEWLDELEPDVDSAVKRELSECLEPMIDRLPDRYRTAVQLSEIEQKTQKEVAEIENLSLSGAKSRVQRGRKILKEMLSECCTVELDRSNRPVEINRQGKDCRRC